MSLKTKLLELFKYEPDKDGAQTFNIKSALNDNWDKIEAWAQSVKTALTKLVPTSRTVNGKALSADVTLTAADIKMPDSEEDVGAAMAKRAVGTGVLGDEIDLNDIDISGMYRVQKPKNGPYDYGQLLVIHGYGDTIAQVCFDYAANRCAVRCARGLYGASPKWEDWTAIALCAAPEVHELPLVSGFPAQSYANTYYKTQEGIVHLNFCIFRGASTAFVEQETICTMPEGYRPSTVIAAAVGGDGKSFGNGLPAAELHIEPDGRMWFYGSDARINWVYGEITYLAG